MKILVLTFLMSLVGYSSFGSDSSDSEGSEAEEIFNLDMNGDSDADEDGASEKELSEELDPRAGGAGGGAAREAYEESFEFVKVAIKPLKGGLCIYFEFSSNVFYHFNKISLEEKLTQLNLRFEGYGKDARGTDDTSKVFYAYNPLNNTVPREDCDLIQGLFPGQLSVEAELE